MGLYVGATAGYTFAVTALCGSSLLPERLSVRFRKGCALRLLARKRFPQPSYLRGISSFGGLGHCERAMQQARRKSTGKSGYDSTFWRLPE
jgi:hypothetical protein